MEKKTIWDMGRVSAEEFRRQAKMPLLLVVDNVRSQGNIGSLFRTADCFAAEGIVLCGISAVPPSAEIHKTALGAEDTVAWQHYDSTAEAIAALRSQGYRIICLEQVSGSIALQCFCPQPGERYALVVGNEVDGVAQDIVDSADIVLEIPQSGTKHSLNVTISASLAMWEFYKHSNVVGTV